MGDIITKANYIFWGIFAILSVLVFMLIRPFIITILTGIIVAYIFYPLYKYLLKKFRNGNLAATIISLLIIIIIAIPLFFIVSQVVGEARLNYVLIKQSMSNGIGIEECTRNNIWCPITKGFDKLLSEPAIRSQLDLSMQRITNAIIEGASNFILSIPRFLLLLFIMFFVIFFSLRDGHKMMGVMKRILPVSQTAKNRIIQRINDVTFGVVFGLFFVGLSEGILGGLGFWLLGLHSPILWGIVMMLLAILPVLGPPLIWGPAALFLILQGYSENTNSLILKGIILLVYGTLIILPIDMILKPRIMGKKGKLHPTMVVLGVFGGIALFGFIGIILGPVIISLFITFLDIYEEEIR